MTSHSAHAANPAIAGSARPTVLHVSEAFGGGLASAVHEYVNRSVDYDHLLAYVPRPEAPVNESDLAYFASSVVLSGNGPARICSLKRIVSQFNPTIIHAHSAYGGVYARLCVKSSRVPIVYTPHCFGFEREDYSRVHRLAFYGAEKVLGRNTTLVAACPRREASLATRLRHGLTTVLVPNVFDASIPTATFAWPPLLVGMGRLNHQKDPDFFARAVDIARQSIPELRAMWIGDGELQYREKLEGAGVEVTGWISRIESRRLLATPGAIYLHGALWEGFPISVLEARRARVPVIVRESKWMEGENLPIVIDSVHDIAAALDLLKTSRARDLILESLDVALAENVGSTQSARLSEAYERAIAATSAVR